MMKFIFGAILVIGTALFMNGCSKPVSIEQTSYGVAVRNGVPDFEDIVSGQNLLLDSYCRKNCEKAWVFRMPLYTNAYKGQYTLPLSEKLELGVTMTAIMEFDRSGGQTEINKRLQRIAEQYAPTEQYGSADNNMILTWDISTIAGFDLPLGKVKDIVRPLLSTKTLDSAADELAAGGQIAADITQGLRAHLKAINSPLILREVQFLSIDLPPSVTDKNTQNYNLKSQEEIQKKQLSMRERRIMTTHKLNLLELQNEMELDALLQPTLTPAKIAYKWVQTANLFGENGIPFAVTPEMLAPAAGKAYEMSYDMTQIRETIKNRLNQIDTQIKNEQSCAETEAGCDPESKNQDSQ